MRNSLKATIVALLVMGFQQLHADMEIKVTLIEASPDITVTSELASLSPMPGVDSLLAPSVTVIPGTKAKIDLTQDFAIAGQEPIPCGVELEITADENAAGLSYNAKFKLTVFEGFGDAAEKQRPIFQTSTILFNASAQNNVPILLDASGKDESDKKRYIHLIIKKLL